MRYFQHAHTCFAAIDQTDFVYGASGMSDEYCGLPGNPPPNFNLNLNLLK